MYRVGGFSELLPEYKILEDKMLDIIKKSYKSRGYTPIETPSLEKTDVLTAKGGGEVKNQIYGVYGLAQGAEDLKDFSLRFDLTVPLSRYVLDNRGELTFPFKRSQIAKVWRGERQQRGRAKEFYQADIDVIWDSSSSSSSYLFYDAEVIGVAYNTYIELFSAFNLNKTDITIKINNRKIILGFIKSIGLENIKQDISNLIDKKEKIGKDKFEKSLIDLGVNNLIIKDILKLLEFDVTFENLLTIPDLLGIRNKEFLTGINELYNTLSYLYKLNIPKKGIKIDFSIVRGLDYYTGIVFETFIFGDEKLGSIGSGGRYDNLTTYIDPKTSFSGVGFSIGVTRLEEYLFDKISKDNLPKTTSEYLIINFEETINKSLELYMKMIGEGQSVEFYPCSDKLSKQFKYADKKGIKYSIILGQNELDKGVYSIKEMKTGELNEVKL